MAALKVTDVFVGFLLLDQLRQAALHNAGRPLVDQSLAVVVTPDNALDALSQTDTHTVMWKSLGAVGSPGRKNKQTTVFCTERNRELINSLLVLLGCVLSKNSYLLNDALSFI